MAQIISRKGKKGTELFLMISSALSPEGEKKLNS
jgi:hypothetical protein